MPIPVLSAARKRCVLSSHFSDVVHHHTRIVAYIFHQFLMVMVGAAGCAAEHVEFCAAIATHDIEKMVVDAVQQIEAFKALPL